MCVGAGCVLPTGSASSRFCSCCTNRRPVNELDVCGCRLCTTHRLRLQPFLQLLHEPQARQRVAAQREEVVRDAERARVRLRLEVRF
jgi:hypothetical protein